MTQGEMHSPTEVEEGQAHPQLRLDARKVALVIIVLALLFTRLWDLGNRSYSHDESIHAWESWKVATGQSYVHDPVYHGPFLYHWTAAFFTLFGINDVTARLGTAILAVACVLLVWPLRRWLGQAGALFAMALLTISPTLLFRGRFIRHDIVVMTATMAMLVCIFKYLEERQPRWLYVLSGALAIAFCGKANAYINGFVLGTFLVLYLLAEWKVSGKRLGQLPAFDLALLLATLAMPLASPVLIKALGFNPLDYSQLGLIRSLLVVVATIAAAAAVGVWWNQGIWLTCVAIFYAIFLPLYTSLFRNAQGAATGLVGMLGYWLSQQGVARGGQPWYYYWVLLAVYEFLPVLLTSLGAIYALWRLRNARRASPAPAGETRPVDLSVVMAALLFWWNAVNAVVFVWAGEKMPWQAQHIVLPLGLAGGWFLGQVWDRTDWRRLLRNGTASILLWLAAALVALLIGAGLLIGPLRPFSGYSLAQLQATLRWLLFALLLVAAGIALWRAGRRLDRAAWLTLGLTALVVLLGLLTVRTSLRLAFVNQDYATEFLVYAASTPDTAQVMGELEDISRRLAGDRELKIAYDNESSWPFVWYLRDWKTTYFDDKTSPSADAQVILVGPGNESRIKGQLTGKYLGRQYRLIWWPNQDVYAKLTPAKLWSELRSPERRRYWWDIWWSRKYPQSTTSWPYVQRFAMYVRNDVASQLWDYGPEVAGTGIVLPEDEYEKKRVQIAAVDAWGTQGSAPGQLSYPKDIAVDAQGNLYVADTYNHRIQVFDSGGSFLRQWGTQGSAPGQFQEPWGIALDASGNVYVADTWNHRIQKFDAQGTFLQQWGRFGDSGGVLGEGLGLYGPRGLAVDAVGQVLVADTGNKRVARFTAEGAFVDHWGGVGDGPGQFSEPVGVAADSAGKIYVSDTWNQRVQVFDQQHNFLAEWPVLGWEGTGVTNKPYLAVDTQGGVYVSAPDYHWLVKFDGAGKISAVWARFGSDLASVNMPSGIALDAQDNIYVADSANHRVAKFLAIK